MRKEFMRILLDQNIPQALAGWLRKKMPEWNTQHVNELGFQGKTDELQYQSEKDRPC
jgi:predicted nuclease of predicted toxin-antitoxin system